MLYHFTSLLAVVFCVAAASAQSISDIPNCAMTSALESISSTKCEISDFKCICNNKAWITSLLPKIEKDCNADDLKSTPPSSHFSYLSWLWIFSYLFLLWCFNGKLDLEP